MDYNEESDTTEDHREVTRRTSGRLTTAGETSAYIEDDGDEDEDDDDDDGNEDAASNGRLVEPTVSRYGRVRKIIAKARRIFRD